MNGDQVYAEILASIARIETSNKQLIDQMNEICKFKTDMIKTVQEFDDYKKARSDIPNDLQELKETVTAYNIECEHKLNILEAAFKKLEEVVASAVKKVEFLMTWYGRAAAVIVTIQVIIAIMVAVGRYVDIQYVLK